MKKSVLSLKASKKIPGGTQEYISEIPVVDGMISEKQLRAALSARRGTIRIRSGNHIPRGSIFVRIMPAAV